MNNTLAKSTFLFQLEKHESSSLKGVKNTYKKMSRQTSDTVDKLLYHHVDGNGEDIKPVPRVRIAIAAADITINDHF